MQVAEQADCSSSSSFKEGLNDQMYQQPSPLPSATHFALACMQDLGKAQ